VAICFGLPLNHLAALFQDDSARTDEISFTRLVSILLSTNECRSPAYPHATRPPADKQEEQLDTRARTFHAAATDIVEFAMGQSVYGIVSAGKPDFVIVIDEPEAFYIHPWPETVSDAGSKP
jgi:hypothetical protein